MLGMSNQSGLAIDGYDHLWQSIKDILTTPIGTRVFLREYGSELSDLIDNPTNRSTIARIINATAGAIARWEPRVRVIRVQVLSLAVGHIELSILANLVETGEGMTFIVGVG